MTNLKEMTTEELQKLMEEVKKEISSRETKSCIYLTDDHNASRYHLGKYKHWAKIISDVDTTKTNGYAFIGDFISYTGENLVPQNSIVVEMDAGTYAAYRVTGDNQKELLIEGSSAKAATFIKQVKELV